MKGNQLMNKQILTFTILFLTFIGCDDNKTNDSTSESEVITHDIDAADASGFYFNLSSGSEVDSSNSWHLSFQMIPVAFGASTYMMPSLILGETTYTAEYTDIMFNDLENTPASFMSDYFQDASVVQYSGSNEVLQYDMQTHTVSVKNPNRVFVIYELGTHSTYKIQFIEYVGGVIAFKYEGL